MYVITGIYSHDYDCLTFQVFLTGMHIYFQQKSHVFCRNDDKLLHEKSKKGILCV